MDRTMVIARTFRLFCALNQTELQLFTTTVDRTCELSSVWITRGS